MPIEVPAKWLEIEEAILARLPRLEAKVRELDDAGTAEPDFTPDQNVPESVRAVIAHLRAEMAAAKQERQKVWRDHLQSQINADRMVLAQIEQYRQAAEQINQEIIEPLAQYGIELIPAERTYLQAPAFKGIRLPNGMEIRNMGDCVLLVPSATLPVLKRIFADDAVDPNFGDHVLQLDVEALLDENRYQEVLGIAPQQESPEEDECEGDAEGDDLDEGEDDLDEESDEDEGD